MGGGGGCWVATGHQNSDPSQLEKTKELFYTMANIHNPDRQHFTQITAGTSQVVAGLMFSLSVRLDVGLATSPHVTDILLISVSLLQPVC